jgi:hypothetical protein
MGGLLFCLFCGTTPDTVHYCTWILCADRRFACLHYITFPLFKILLSCCKDVDEMEADEMDREAQTEEQRGLGRRIAHDKW